VEEYAANQVTLYANARAYEYDRRRSPARAGVSLLQGLALCGRCGNRMTVRYHVQRDHPAPDYVCQRRGIESAQSACQRIPGSGLDEVVGRIVLEALTPASLQVALEVFEELRARKAEVHRLHRAQVQRAREEVEVAQRQFMLVRPENRLVADNLERLWNEKLAGLAKAEEDYTRLTKTDDPEIAPETKERICTLASDLPRVWNDPRTPARERKRMLRLLIEDVALARDHAIQVHIRWKGGTTTSLEHPLPLAAPDLRRTPAAIVEQVRALATEQTDKEIARTLNVRWMRTGTGKPFTRLIVRHVRDAYGIPSLAQHLRGVGWLTLIVRVADRSHRRPHAGLTAAFAEGDRGVLGRFYWSSMDRGASARVRYRRLCRFGPL
jgi:hypothetical protein